MPSINDEGWIRGKTAHFNSKKHHKYRFDQLDPLTHTSSQNARENFGSWSDENDPSHLLVGQLLWAKNLIQEEWDVPTEDNQYLWEKHEKERTSAEYKENKASATEAIDIDDHMAGYNETLMGFHCNHVSACRIQLLRLVLEPRPRPQKKVVLKLVSRGKKGRHRSLHRSETASSADKCKWSFETSQQVAALGGD